MNGLENVLAYVMSDRVQRLRRIADSLDPDHPVELQIMEDEDLIRRSAGAAVTHPAEGGEIIHLDSERASEWAIAHEMAHVIIHRSGWPVVSSSLGQRDILGLRLAGELTNFVQHYLFFPVLEGLGFEVSAYRNFMLDAICDWPDSKVEGPAKLWNSLKLLEVMSYGEEYRSRVIAALQPRQPELLALARRLQKLIEPARTNELGVRRSMVNIISYLDKWITTESRHPAMLENRLAISPVFTEWQISRPAHEATQLVTTDFHFNNQLFLLCGVVSKSNAMPYATVALEIFDPAAEPSYAGSLRDLWQSATLGELFVAKRFRYGIRGRSWWNPDAYMS